MVPPPASAPSRSPEALLGITSVTALLVASPLRLTIFTDFRNYAKDEFKNYVITCMKFFLIVLR